MARAIFPGLLGATFDELPEPLQELHCGEESAEWHGEASLRGAQNLAGRMVAALFNLPAHDHRTDARVSIKVTPDGETWTRSFGGKEFRSHLSLGTGLEAGLMCERFGILTVAMAITWKDDKLWFVPRRWRVGPVPLPSALLPGGDTFECEHDGLFAFDVRVEVPIIGLVAAYRGTLQKQD
ncbi:MAG: DUF4166 domain-containing protein [Woeseiaceae bacterium]|nr:DUF4166 domain-containing protein [Woeseiaceae bacterium]